MVLEILEPTNVWKIFEEFCIKTYRSSGFEHEIAQKIITWVENQKELGITWKKDAIGNILLKKPSSPGREAYPPILLQCHLDMVTETDRPGGFDFAANPIPVRIDEKKEWVDAERTTLGADNGIGVAMALSLLTLSDTELPHGPLEVLLTVSEETGLDGAFGLDINEFMIQSRLMINIDSEEIGYITIGSAGGSEIELQKTIPEYSIEEIKTQNNESLEIYELSIKGLFGGHSGVDIHLPRGNAIKIAANILSLSLNATDAIYLHSWNGGNKRNAIPREVSVTFGIPNSQKEKFTAKIQENIEHVRKYYAQIKPDGQVIEKNIAISFKVTTAEGFLDKTESINLICFINNLPHGVMQMSAIISNLVETSINLAKIRGEKGIYECHLMARSSIDHELEILRQRVADLANLNKWKVKLLQSYSGWTPDITQPLLQYVQKQYTQIYEPPIRFGAIHAGLECGIIGRKFPGMQMVAIGPEIQNPHTPEERVNIKSVQILYRLLQEIIKNIETITSIV